MRAHKDIYAAIANHLRTAPVALLCLSLVSREANAAVTAVFPAMLIERASVSCHYWRGGDLRSRALTPYTRLDSLVKFDVNTSLSYMFAWGELMMDVVEWEGGSMCVTVRINHRHVVNIRKMNGKPPECRDDSIERHGLAAIRFVLKVFPNIQIEL